MMDIVITFDQISLNGSAVCHQRGVILEEGILRREAGAAITSQLEELNDKHRESSESQNQKRYAIDKRFDRRSILDERISHQ